jgi:hypothetical protein
MCYKNCPGENWHGECKLSSGFHCAFVICEYCGEEFETIDYHGHGGHKGHKNFCEKREDNDEM